MHHTVLPFGCYNVNEAHVFLPCIKCRKAQATNNRLGDALGIDHLIAREVQMQILLMDIPKAAEISADLCTRPLTGIAMDFAYAILAIAGPPLVPAVDDPPMVGEIAAIV